MIGRGISYYNDVQMDGSDRNERFRNAARHMVPSSNS